MQFFYHLYWNVLRRIYNFLVYPFYKLAMWELARAIVKEEKEHE